MVTAIKLQSGWNDISSQWKNEDCPSRMLLKRLLKRFLNVWWSPILIPFQNGDNKTTLKNLKQFMGVIKLKPNLCTKNFGRRDKETDRIPPSENLNCWAKLHEMVSTCQYARTHLKPLFSFPAWQGTELMDAFKCWA